MNQDDGVLSDIATNSSASSLHSVPTIEINNQVDTKKSIVKQSKTPKEGKHSRHDSFHIVDSQPVHNTDKKKLKHCETLILEAFPNLFPSDQRKQRGSKWKRFKEKLFYESLFW